MELSLTESLLIAILLVLVGIFFVALSIAGFWGWLGKLIFPPATQWDDRGFGEHLADRLKSLFSDAVDLVLAIVGLVGGGWSVYLLAGKFFGVSAPTESGTVMVLGFFGSVAGLFLVIILREKLSPRD